MKLPKTRPGRQDVDGELLVGILLGPSAHGPGHADLALPFALEPFAETTGQPSNTITFSDSQPGKYKERPRSILCTHLI